MHRSYLFFLLLTAAFFVAFSKENKCGNDFFTSKEKLDRLKPLYDNFGLKKGDTVLSIGASNGWFEAGAAVYYDSLTFILEDIDSTCLNENEILQTKSVFSQIKGEKLTCSFIPVTGNDSCTTLPAEYVKTIIMNDVYHHFTKKEKMLKDIFSVCRKNGKLFLIEPIAEKKQKNPKKCDYYTSETLLVNEFEQAGFRLVEKKEPFKGTFCFVFIKS